VRDIDGGVVDGRGCAQYTRILICSVSVVTRIYGFGINTCCGVRVSVGWLERE